MTTAETITPAARQLILAALAERLETHAPPHAIEAAYQAVSAILEGPEVARPDHASRISGFLTEWNRAGAGNTIVLRTGHSLQTSDLRALLDEVDERRAQDSLPSGPVGTVLGDAVFALVNRLYATAAEWDERGAELRACEDVREPSASRLKGRSAALRGCADQLRTAIAGWGHRR